MHRPSPALWLSSSFQLQGILIYFFTLVPFPLAHSDLTLRAKKNAVHDLGKIGIYLPGAFFSYKVLVPRR
jgi:hypothetical protein